MKLFSPHIVIPLAALALVGGGIALNGKEASSENRIVLTKDGFSPSELRITQGESVTFSSELEEPFWPASNVHPTHGVYPEFDPRESVAAGESWSFTFEQPGTWRFHDHIRPFFVGTITVVPLGGSENQYGLSSVSPEDCENPSVAEREQCWDALLYSALQEGGPASALNALIDLHREQPSFAESGCHWHAHRIGEEAYRAMRGAEKVEIPENASFCGYGFVHGLFEHKFREEQNLEEARQLCRSLTEELREQLPRFRLNCFHAIGHGFTADPPPVGMWGDAAAMLREPLAVCDGVSSDAREVRECYDGAYNTIVIFGLTNQYGLSHETGNPLSFCKSQERRHQEACYYEFSQLLSQRSVEEVAGLVENIEDREIAEMIVNAAAAGIVQEVIAQDDFQGMTDACHGVRGQGFSLSCIRGAVGGFMAHGLPGKEYEKAILFCESPSLESEERDACFGNLALKLKDIYPAEKVAQICSGIDSPYNQHC